jgi:hypothetical protein
MPKQPINDEQVIPETSGVTDEVQVRISGPDPEVWGTPEERLAQDIEDGKTNGVNEELQRLLEAGEHPVVELEGGGVIKGPDPAVWGVPNDGPAEELITEE